MRGRCSSARIYKQRPLERDVMTRIASPAPAACAARAYSRPPFARGLAVYMMQVYIILLFIISANILDMIGYETGSIGGNPITKIHISTYFVALTFVVFLLTYQDKSALIEHVVSTKLGTIFFFLATNVAFINIVVGKRQGNGMYFDTHLNLFCCAMMLPFVSPPLMDRLERFIHWFFVLNAVTGVAELVAGGNFFPVAVYSTESTTFETRATAFLTHPLHAATLTSVYVFSLMSGGGQMLPPRLRAPMIGLQLAALVAFSGRTALILTGAAIGLSLLWKIVQFTSGRKISYSSLIVSAILLPICIGGVAYLTYIGLFDSFILRFSEDAGSARTRLLMFDLLASFDFADLFWGAAPDFIASRVVSYGLEWGVENPFIAMSVFQGVAMTTFIVLGYLGLLRDACSRLRPAAIIPMIVFISLCSTFGSFGGSFFTFSIFLVIVCALFRRRDVSHVL